MPCCVYKDPLLITAQALSIVAFFFSFGGIVALLLGLAAMIVLQVVWCCRMNKCGLNTAASFAAVVAVIDIILAITILIQGQDACGEGLSDNEDCNWQAAGIVVIISAVLWIAVASLVFTFANSARFTKCWNDSDPNGGGRPVVSKSAKAATATPMAASSKPRATTTTSSTTSSPAKSTTPDSTNTNEEEPNTSTETTEYPDGTRKTVTTTILADGSKSVTETIEQPTKADTLSEP
ncbi:hypothetical protein ACA910_016299 [Epithemia clementina (nom. ined.)]